jgi:hypothetical protein
MNLRPRAEDPLLARLPESLAVSLYEQVVADREDPCVEDGGYSGDDLGYGYVFRHVLSFWSSSWRRHYP